MWAKTEKILQIFLTMNLERLSDRGRGQAQERIK